MLQFEVPPFLALPAGVSDALQHHPLVAVATLFGAGLLTSLSPCIYPMIPITAGLLAGSVGTATSRRRAVGLTLTYVTGLALFYGLLGLLAGLSGSLFGTVGSNPCCRRGLQRGQGASAAAPIPPSFSWARRRASSRRRAGRRRSRPCSPGSPPRGAGCSASCISSSSRSA